MRNIFPADVRRLHRWNTDETQIDTDIFLCWSVFFYYFIIMTEDDITEKIIGCAYSVARELGFGFWEKVYENAMIIELSDKKLQVENQKPINVFYHGKNVGQYFAPEKVEIKRVINGY